MSLIDLERAREAIERAEPLLVAGRVLKASGLIIEASLPKVALGTCCEIRSSDGRLLPAEVVGFSAGAALLVPFGEMQGVCEGCPVSPRSITVEVSVGEALLGRYLSCVTAWHCATARHPRCRAGGSTNRSRSGFGRSTRA